MKSTKELLAYKRDGGEWSADEISSFVRGVVSGSITHAQASAFLMAACIRGLSDAETASLTLSMSTSGAVLKHGNSSRKRIDKHSTGGVGDKVSLLVTPLAVACGLDVPMISGRGLGHTGGTVDKLESIIGFRTSMSVEEQTHLLTHHHVFMTGQSENIAPADKILYSLRDATGTVENIGLITASILSKKIAEGIDGLVLDVKVGSAAFMKNLSDAEQLARSMKRVGALSGLPIIVVFSRMDTFLGRTVGNWVEVVEAESSLAQLSTAEPRLAEIATELVARMLIQADRETSINTARTTVQQAWRTGVAHNEFMALIERQGGRWTDSVQHYAAGTHSIEINAQADGVFLAPDGMSIAQAILHAGGGRRHESDIIDHAVGLELIVDIGTKVKKGETIARVYATELHTCTMLAEQLRTLLKTTTAPRIEEPSIIIEVWE